MLKLDCTNQASGIAYGQKSTLYIYTLHFLVVYIYLFIHIFSYGYECTYLFIYIYRHIYE